MTGGTGPEEREAFHTTEPIKMTGVAAPRKKHNFSPRCSGGAGKEAIAAADPLPGDEEQCSQPPTKLFLILYYQPAE